MKAKNARVSFAIILFCFTCGCASSGGPPENTLACDDSYQHMWSAVQAVVLWMGGKVELANQSGGMLLVSFLDEEQSTKIQLHIEISRSPGEEMAFLHGVTVTVKAVDLRVSHPDRYLSNYLKAVQERFLEEVAARAEGCLRSLK